MVMQPQADEVARPILRPIWRSRPVRLAATIAALLVAGAASAPAAVILATPTTDEIGVGEQVFVDVSVQLGAGETASIFEADFELVGVGTIASVSLAPGGPTWPNAEGNVAGGFASVSLTSNNAGATRRVGRLTVTGAQAGSFEVRLGTGTVLQRDIVADPFFANVPLTTAADALLATIEVVPEPGAQAIGACALGALAMLQYRRVQHRRVQHRRVQCTRARSRSSTATKFS